MGKHVATLSTLLIFSSNLYAGSLSVRVDGQTVTAKVCNISQGAKNVSYQIGEKGYAKNGISQPESNKENGCSIKVYANQPTSLIQKGIEVVATYTRADGSTWTQTMSASGGSSTPTLPNPPVTPRPGTPSTPTLPNPVTPRPGTPTQPPVTPRPGTPTLPEPTVPEKKTTPDAKVSGWAEDAANFMANRVVEKFGGVENFRYSFFEGFKASERSFNNLGVSITNLPEYHNERAKGQNEGTSHGFRLGGDAGARDGNSMGSQAARARFQQAVGNPAALDVASGALPSGQNFQGLQGDKTVPSFDRMLNEYNDVFLDEVKRYLRLETEFSDDVIAEIYGNYWGLSYLYGWKDYQYDTVFSSWRADNAFTLFLNKKLVREGSDRGKIEANNRMVAKYKEITNPDEYSDADDSKRRFRSAFINQYNDVIGRKWRNEVYGSN